MAPDLPDSIDTEALAKAVVDELDPGTVVDDKLVVSRRQVIALAGSGLGAGALATWATGDAAAADGTNDTSVGDVGAAGDSVDVFVDEFRDEQGDEWLDVDDTGDINAAFGREFLFDALSTDTLNTADLASASANQALAVGSPPALKTFNSNLGEQLAAVSDTSPTSQVAIDTGSIPAHDYFLVDLSIGGQETSGTGTVSVTVNQITNSYRYTVVNGGTVSTVTGDSSWDFGLVGTDAFSVQLVISQSSAVAADTRQRPTITQTGGHLTEDTILQGEQKNDTGDITRIDISTDYDAVAEMRVYGRDIL